MYQVEGYAFETKEQEHTAKHEVEIIGYIRKNTRMDDPDIVLALYNKLVLKEIFVTPVGYDFLHRLQEYLYTIPYIRREDILPITVYEPEGMVSKEKRSKEEIKQKKKRQKNRRKVKQNKKKQKNGKLLPPKQEKQKKQKNRQIVQKLQKHRNLRSRRKATAQSA